MHWPRSWPLLAGAILLILLPTAVHCQGQGKNRLEIILAWTMISLFLYILAHTAWIWPMEGGRDGNTVALQCRSRSRDSDSITLDFGLRTRFDGLRLQASGFGLDCSGLQAVGFRLDYMRAAVLNCAGYIQDSGFGFHHERNRIQSLI